MNIMLFRGRMLMPGGAKACVTGARFASSAPAIIVAGKSIPCAKSNPNTLNATKVKLPWPSGLGANSSHLNVPERSETLKIAADVDSVSLFNVHALTHRINVAFGPPGDMLRLHLKALADLKQTAAGDLAAELATTADTEAQWLAAVVNNKANLEQNISDAKQDKLRKDGPHADCAGQWGPVGLDGGSIEDLVTRYQKDVEAMTVDIQRRGERIAALKQQAADAEKTHAAAVDAAKARVVEAIGKLRDVNEQLSRA